MSAKENFISILKRSRLRSYAPFIDIDKKFYNTYRKYHHKAGASSLKNWYYLNKIYKKYHCHVNPNAEIGEGTTFPHPIGIVIGQRVKIGKNCTIYQNVTLGRRNVDDETDIPEIGNNVLIGCNSVILGKVKVGDEAKIAAGSIVLRDVKPGETVHGVVK